MKKAITLLFSCALALYSLQLCGMPPCFANDSTEFKACLSGNATNIKIMADFTVHLTGFSLKGVTVDIGSRSLTITGNPSLDSTTVFNTSGAEGELIIITPGGTYVFKENTVHGGINLDFLNETLIFPLYVESLYEAIAQAMILPVTWGTFSATLSQQAVVLEWTSATELNNDKFIIESSADGELFHSLGQLKGAGTSSEAKRYRFVHRNPSAGINYYRLKQVDFDGTYAFSKVLAIDAPGNPTLLAFPNPVKDRLYLQYDYAQGPSQIQVLDALGRRIAVNIGGEAGNYDIQLPSDLPRGAYWLRVVRKGAVQAVTVMKE